MIARQAIVTKYLGPTNHRYTRVKATAFAGSVTVEWDDSLNTELNHAVAAKTLADKYGWLDDKRTKEDYEMGIDRPRLYGGGMPDGSSFCFVIVDERDKSNAFKPKDE